MNTKDTEALGNYIKMINKSNDESTKSNQQVTYHAVYRNWRPTNTNGIG